MHKQQIIILDCYRYLQNLVLPVKQGWILIMSHLEARLALGFPVSSLLAKLRQPAADCSFMFTSQTPE